MRPVWNTAPIANFPPADVVLGQGDFTHGTENDDNQDNVADGAASARVFYRLSGLLFYRDRLLVNDIANNRTLIFRSN